MDLACPQDYSLLGANCYRYYNSSASQKLASDTCRAERTYLASVSSSQEDLNEIQSGWVNLGMTIILTSP